MARENLNGINVVHAYNAEDYQNAKFWKGNEELMRTQLFNQRAFAFLMPGVTLAMNALSLVIYWVGASIVNAVPAADTAARLAAFSDIVVFGTYATYVIMSIMMMVMIIMMLPAAQVSAQRINEVLETRNSLTQGARIDALETGTVEFRDVSFHYPSSDKNVLEHITFQAKRGRPWPLSAPPAAARPLWSAWPPGSMMPRRALCWWTGWTFGTTPSTPCMTASAM